MTRRLRTLVPVALGAALVCPPAADAHGLIQRANLPIPEWLFGWAAAIVLVVSFLALALLWPKAKLEGNDGWQPLPGVGRVLGSRAAEETAQVIGAGLLVVVLVAGFAGVQSSAANLAPTFVFITFWVGLAFASAFFGDVFRAFNPWRAWGRAAGWLVSRVRRRTVRHRPYPARLGRWPAAIGLLGFTWIELASGYGEAPQRLALAASVYSAFTFAAMARYGAEPWTRCGETFSVYFNLFSRLSPFERRDGVVGVRPLLGGLTKLEPLPGTVAVVCVMIGTVSFDGLESGKLWKDAKANIEATIDPLGLSIQAVDKVTATVGLLAAVAVVSLFYAGGIRGARTVGGELGAARLRRVFIHTLVPIALVYVAAHYVSYLITEGQAIKYLASDPLGQGWNLFGTAKSAINYGLLSQNQTWYLQVGFVIAGHVAALVLAHDRALVVYGQPRMAVRSQYWMLGIMVGFTSLALWLLAQAGST